MMTGQSPVIELTELTRDRVCFTLRHADASIANALRRIMIAEVPTLAIELVTMIENTSVLHDEFIAHRLGLLPIDSTRIREYKYKEECSCADRCRNCSVEFQLDVICREQEGATITHLDLTGTDPTPGSPMPVPRAEDLASGAGAAPITIAKLRRNQRLKCHLVATKGIGKLHAKWIPTATAVFQYEPEIVINEKLLETVPPDIQQEIARACPRNVFACEGDAFTPPTLTVARRMACIFCDECVAAAKQRGYPDLLRVTHKPDVFRFVVESTGALPPDQIVELAFEVLDKKLKDLLSETTKLEGFTVEDAVAERGADRARKEQRPAAAGVDSWDRDFVLDLS